MATGSFNFMLSATIDGFAIGKAKSGTFTLTGEDYDEGTITLTTTFAQVSLKAGMGTVGWFWIYNSDATNYIKIGDYNAGSPRYFGRVPPGMTVPFYLDLAANNIAWIADTASCKIHFLAFER